MSYLNLKFSVQQPCKIRLPLVNLTQKYVQNVILKSDMFCIFPSISGVLHRILHRKWIECHPKIWNSCRIRLTHMPLIPCGLLYYMYGIFIIIMNFFLYVCICRLHFRLLLVRFYTHSCFCLSYREVPHWGSICMLFYLILSPWPTVTDSERGTCSIQCT